MTKILFISRAYPPVTGGLENQNYELSLWLPKISDTYTIANRHGKMFLPLFFPYAKLKALFMLKDYDALLLGDAVLSPLGLAMKMVYKKPVICITHGLDLTYPLGIYQKLWVGFFMKKMDRIIAVGNETIEVGVKRGIKRENFTFIPNGVDTEKFIEPHTREDLEKVVGESLAGKKILLTTGRLAAHKGVDWFSENVMPKLSDDILYLIAGDGEKKKNIEKIIKDKGLENKVKLLGKVSDHDLKVLYNTADIYIKPNIKVPGTMEGFGLVAIEAASAKLPVIASNLEGLKDAIKEGQNGFLIEPYDSDGYIRKISDLLADDAFRKNFGEKARSFVVENYSWDKISKRYLEEIEKEINKKK